MTKIKHLKQNRIIIPLIMAVMLIFMHLTGCKNTQQVTSNKDTQINDQHNSRNSLDWAGTYHGRISGLEDQIYAVLVLNPDDSYKLNYSYKDKGGQAFVTTGTFKWDKSGSRISMRLLENHTQEFRVVENGLEPLDQKGMPIEGEFAYLNRFKKIEQNMIQEKYWKLTEIGGQAIHFTGSKEPHMILKGTDSSVRGFAGCNGFGGQFELLPGNRIRFSQLISTKMACPDLKVENAFMQVLEKADNYTQQGDTLYLNKARMAPLAKFVAVYL